MLIDSMYAQAVTYPSMAAMLSMWAPPLERSKIVTFVYAGNECKVLSSLDFIFVCEDHYVLHYILPLYFYIFSLYFINQRIFPTSFSLYSQNLSTRCGKQKQKAFIM